MIVARDHLRESPLRAKLNAPPRERGICKVLFHNGSDDAQVHANTRLIAMAPELYERLEATVYALEKLPITGAAAGYYKTLLKEANEVLAKARGEKA